MKASRAVAPLGRALALAFALAGCESRTREAAVPSAPATPAPAPAPAQASPVEGLDYLERCPASGCDARLPLVIALHGLGDTPESFGSVYDGLRTPARVLVLRAPLPWAEGRAWFPYRSVNTPPETLAPQLVALVPRVLATIDRACAARPCDGRVVVSGFSQGGMLTYALAARAPERFVAMVPIGGFLVPGIEPLRAAHTPSLVVFHGEADRIVLPEWDHEGAARLSQAGYDVDFHLVPGVGHTIPPAVRDEVLSAIDRALAPQ